MSQHPILSYPHDMCGICGVLERRGAASAATVAAMTRTLAHRGPDADGVHVDGPLGLGHRRLSIIDLSDAARQPITNEDETVWLVFNGEIYNFRELEQTLVPRHRFKSQSDGEVIVHLYEELGERAIEALDGMFALALWDAREQRLLLARDRVGKKPLYYHDGPGLFAFGSEMKALLAHPGLPPDRDEGAIPLFLTYGYVPTPRTFYRGIKSLPPGTTLSVTAAKTGEPKSYWTPRFENGSVKSDEDAEDRFRELLRSAVRRRLVADVPLGAFLSGGLDSSAVVALMAREARGRVRTFTIGFEGGGDYDERAHARVVAERFGTDHTEFVVEPRALDLIDRLVWHHDGPFGDSSAVPTYLLSELTRSHVTVALNGDGGDEVFAGYLRLYGGAISEHIPRPLFRLMASVLGLLPEPEDRKHVLRFAKRFAEAGSLPLAERYLRWNAYFTDDLEALVRPELRPHCRPGVILESFRTVLDRPRSPRATTLTRLLELNFETYLLDDLLVKMDRMSMAHGLEARSPFLDTAVVEFGASLPDRLRMRLGKGKLLLRRAMRDVLPPSILARGKMGFGAPLGAWFRNDLAGFVRERLLDPGSALNEYLEPAQVTAVVEHHMAGAGDVSARLWALLTLESWLRQTGVVDVPAPQPSSPHAKPGDPGR